MTTNSTTKTVVAIALVAVVLLLLSQCDSIRSTLYGDRDTVTVVRERKVIVPPDTVFVDRYIPRIQWRTAKPDTVHDSIYIDRTDTNNPRYGSRAFTAVMDTTILCTKVQVQFKYPELRFDSLRIETCPDTVAVADTTKVIREGDGFWEDAGEVGIGVAIGAVVTLLAIVFGQ
jgi:hypothetical protein